MAGWLSLCCLSIVLFTGTANASSVCSRKNTFFSTTYTIYFSCSNCCCGDIEERYCCGCNNLWWLGTVIGSVIGGIVFIVVVVCVICILVKHNKSRTGRVIAPGQAAMVGTSHSITTTSGGGYPQTINTGPQPVYPTYQTTPTY